MSNRSSNLYLGLAIILIVMAYLCWKPILVLTGGDLEYYQLTGDPGNGIDIYWPLQSIFFFMVCFYIFKKEDKVITYILFGLSLNNVIDELFFDNQILSKNELFVCVTLLLLGIYKYGNLNLKTLRKILYVFKNKQPPN